MDVLHVYLIQNMKTICKGFENMQTIYETNEKKGIAIKLTPSIFKPKDLPIVLDNINKFFSTLKKADQHMANQHK